MEEYNTDIEDIENKVQEQIDTIEEVIYNIESFDKNILENIYEYFVQYRKRNCNISLIDELSISFTSNDWYHLFSTYILSDNFLLENSDKLLIYIYRKLQN